MATQDVINTAITQLKALTATSSAVTALEAQIATTQAQLVSLQKQLATAVGSDGKNAKMAVTRLQNILRDLSS